MASYNTGKVKKPTTVKPVLQQTEPEKPVHHEVYPYIGTSDRQRAYLVKHGIPHVRKDGTYR